VKSEIHLFILWENARKKCENEILNDIESNFEVLQIIEIEWNRKDFSDNISQFYGIKLPPRCNKVKEVGDGKFLLVIIRDNHPMYVVRRTNSGDSIVNVNVFDSKEMYRRWVGGHNIHSSNTVEEAEHDLGLLLGKTIKELEDIYKLQETIKEYKERI